MEAKRFTYEVKCRRCGGLTDMYFGESTFTSEQSFISFMYDKIQHPVMQDCKCDKKRIMIHDIVSCKSEKVK